MEEKLTDEEILESILAQEIKHTIKEGITYYARGKELNFLEKPEVYERLGFRLAQEIPYIFSCHTNVGEKILDCLVTAVVEELTTKSWTAKAFIHNKKKK